MEAKPIEERALAGHLRARIFAGASAEYRSAQVGRRLVVTTSRFPKLATIVWVVILALVVAVPFVLIATSMLRDHGGYEGDRIGGGAFLGTFLLIVGFGFATVLRNEISSWSRLLVFELDARELVTQEMKVSTASIEAITLEWSETGWLVRARRRDEHTLLLATVMNEQDARWLESRIREFVA